jgi:Raf kinase inhibitor-like YbhB/YbcL family protein
MLRIIATLGIVLAAATPAMVLESRDFPPGGAIPSESMATDCGGQNRSPELAWTDAPKGAKSFALIVHDPDAPIPGGFFHWVVYNLPVTTHRLDADAKLAADQLGKTSRGGVGYYGPCPPPGPTHHYAFTLLALDVPRIPARAPLTASALGALVTGHVLARAVLQGTASRH